MKEISPWRIRRIAEPPSMEPELTYSMESDEVHLSYYWNILVKRRRTIIAAFVLIFAIGSYFVLSATPLYTATATLKIEIKNPQVTGVGAIDASGGATGNYDYYQTQFALLRSRPLAARVISDLDLKSNPAFTNAQVVSPNPASHLQSWTFRALGYFSSYVRPLLQPVPHHLQSSDLSETESNSGGRPVQLQVSPQLIDRYLRFATVAPVLKTTLVKVQFTTPDPLLSQALSNAHVQRFLQMNLENRFDLTKEARDFLEQKKVELRAKMQKSEEALNSFRRTHGVVSLEKGENIVVDRLVDLNRQLTVARAQRIEAESLNRTVERKNHQDLLEIMKHGLIHQLKGNLASLESEKVRLTNIFRGDHPRMQDLDQQIAAARDALNKEILAVVQSTQSTYAAAVAKERALEAEAMQQQQRALNLKEVGVNYTLLQEEVNATRSLYENVLKRLSETNVSNDTAMSNMQITEIAERPRSPSSPNIPMFLLANMCLGLFAGVGLAMFKEYFNSGVTTPEDVSRSVGLSTLGVVPHLKYLKGPSSKRARLGHISSGEKQLALSTEAARGVKELIISRDSPSIVSECYRTIRTSFLLSQAERPPQVILLTSPSPGEGKSVSTLNLAIALAYDGNSVLVVDGDMRKGCCHDRLGLGNETGLSHVLTGSATIQEAVQPTSLNGLTLLSRGAVPPNPSELLGSRKMKELIQEMRDAYAFVLIDSPPVLGISDAAVLSILCDGVLLVFNGHATSTTAAQKAVTRLDGIRAHLLGVILNGVNLRDPHYSYFHDYAGYYTHGNGHSLTGAGNGNGVHDASPRGPNGGVHDDMAKSGRHAYDSDAADHTPHVNGNGDSVVPRKAQDVEFMVTGETVPGYEPASRFTSSSQAPSDHANRSDLVSQIVASLRKAIGPIAAEIVREQIASLGESFYSFPEGRRGELLSLLRGELTEDEYRSFLGSLPSDIHTVKNL